MVIVPTISTPVETVDSIPDVVGEASIVRGFAIGGA